MNNLLKIWTIILLCSCRQVLVHEQFNMNNENSCGIDKMFYELKGDSLLALDLFVFARKIEFKEKQVLIEKIDSVICFDTTFFMKRTEKGRYDFTSQLELDERYSQARLFPDKETFSFFKYEDLAGSPRPVQIIDTINFDYNHYYVLKDLGSKQIDYQRFYMIKEGYKIMPELYFSIIYCEKEKIFCGYSTLNVIKRVKNPRRFLKHIKHTDEFHSEYFDEYRQIQYNETPRVIICENDSNYFELFNLFKKSVIENDNVR